MSRAQMAVFLLKAEHAPFYLPPAATGAFFDDVSVDRWAAAWVAQLAAEGITGACSEDPVIHCPDGSVTRAQIAVFLVRIFGPPLP